MSLRADEVTPWTVGALTAGIVLVPYLTLWVDFRRALHIQAGLVLVATLAILGAGLLRRPRPTLRRFHVSPPLLGVALYALAAIVGCLVGLWRGNSLTQIAGQALSMGLLVLGFLAGRVVVGSRRDGDSSAPWAVGLVAGTALASALHLSVWIAGALEGAAEPRWLLRNAVSVVAPSLPAFLMAVGLAADGARARRWGARIAAALILLYALGSGVRSLWIVLSFGVVAYAVLRQGLHRSLVDRRTAAVALALVAFAGLLWGGSAWLGRERPNLLPSADPGEVLAASPRAVSDPMPARAGTAYRAIVCFAAAPRGDGRFGLEWLSEGGETVGRSTRSIPPRAGAGCRVSTGGAPEGTAAARLVVETAGAAGEWRLSAVRVHELGPAPVSVVAHQLEYSARRILSIPSALLDPERRSEDAITVDFRVRESARLFELHRESSPTEKWLGHGLGATFLLDIHGYDNRGQWTYYGETHYIHDFYLFLLYKLGWVGTVWVGGALALWLLFLVRMARDRRHGAGDPLVAAVAAAFLAGALWSVSSPVFLNFRTAPLWGLLLSGVVPPPGRPEPPPEESEA